MHQIEWTGAAFGDKDFMSIAHPELVDDISLDNTDVTDSGFSFVSRMVNLKGISVHGGKLTSAGIRHLASCTQIEAVVLRDVHVDDSAIGVLSECKLLSTLNIVGGAVRGEWMGSVGWSALQCLSIEESSLSSHGLGALAKMAEVNTFAGCNNRADFPRCSHVSEKMEYLYLDDTDVSDEGIERICDSFPNLRNLTVAGTRVTDAMLKRVSAMPNLRQLRVSRTPVSRNGLLLLSEMKQLELLEVCDNGLSPEDRDVLVTAMRSRVHVMI